MIRDRYLFVPGKYDYVRGKRPGVACILCAVVERSEAVDRLEIHRTDRWIVSLNRYPYNPGHLLLFPSRHTERFDALEPAEVTELHGLQVRCMEILDDQYRPGGYNLGTNLGHASGASIRHLHVHVVPRYAREVGFMDLLGGAKIMVEEPGTTMERLRDAFARAGRSPDGPRGTGHGHRA